MITIKKPAPHRIEITVKDKIEADDFKKAADMFKKAIETKKKPIRMLIDARAFNGWEDIPAASSHFNFIKDHHQHVERIAVISGHLWHHWMSMAVMPFVNPVIQVFEEADTDKARTWLNA